MSGQHHTLTPADISRMTEIAARLGSWALPVVNALGAGQLSLVMLTRDQRAPLNTMRRSPLPVLCWLGDDDELSCGPDGWRPALQAIAWTRAALVHAAGGERKHYSTLVAGTRLTGRMLLIETASRHAEAWAALLQGKQTLIILPRYGKHPILSTERQH